MHKAINKILIYFNLNTRADLTIDMTEMKQLEKIRRKPVNLIKTEYSEQDQKFICLYEIKAHFHALSLAIEQWTPLIII